MKNLSIIIAKANEKLNKNVFGLKDENTLINTENRYEGNDIDMVEEDGSYILTMTGVTEKYDNINDAVVGLIDLYDNA